MSYKVLITGGAGFIGLHLAKRLLDDGHKVCLVDNLLRSVKDIDFDRTLNRDNAEFLSLDLLDVNSLQNLNFDFDYIFHLAAIIGVKHVLERPYDVLYDNIQMLTNIINFSHQQENLLCLFYASTSEVYDGTLKYFDLPIPTPEDTPLALTDLSYPRTSYMLSKIYGEALCHQSGLPFTIFRPYNIYGPRMGMSHVIPEQLYKAHNANDGDTIEVFSVDHTRSFCYVDDAVEMLVRMMENADCLGKALNLGNQSTEITMRDVAQLCFSVTEKYLVVNEKSPSPGSPERRSPNMEQTIRLTEFESKVDLFDGVSRTYEWYKTNFFEGSDINYEKFIIK